MNAGWNALEKKDVVCIKYINKKVYDFYPRYSGVVRNCNYIYFMRIFIRKTSWNDFSLAVTEDKCNFFKYVLTENLSIIKLLFKKMFEKILRTEMQKRENQY